MSTENKIEEIAEEIPQGAEVAVISKNEKKARALIAKLNLKKVDGISRVTYKRKGNQIYAIDNPEVYKSTAGTYVVFGEAKLEDLTQRLQQAEAQAQASGVLPAEHDHDHDHGHDHDHEHAKDPASITADLQAASLNDKQPEEDDDEDVDDSDVSPSDVDIIVEQTGVSRAKAIKVLRKHDGDIVNAIMEISTA